jgi:hypothetical protein
MSRILKVSNGDYRLQVQSGGNIILDPGSTGTVTVVGNLDVKGITTTIESINTTVQDNVLQLNFGQTGNGISSTNAYQSGIEIGRGNYSAAQLIFTESVNHYDSQSSTTVSGTWSLKTADGKLSAVQLRTITTDGLADLIFDLQSQNPVLKLANATGPSGAYYLRVTDVNHIPNLQYIQQYVASNYNGTGQGIAIVNSVQYPLSGTVAAANTSIALSSTNIVFQVAQTTIASITSTGVSLGNLQVGGTSTPNTITNTTSNNLILTSSNGVVEVNATITLDDQTAPTYASGKSKIYSSATAGPGRTGIYFTNATSQTPDELISRNRAVLLSILL